MSAQNFIKRVFLLFLIFSFGVISIVVLIDPFFHYHKPWFGLSAIQWKKEYQVNGALDHLDYDALLVGSSVVSNIDNNMLDRAYGCESIKAIASGATTDTLYYYINRAYSSHKLDYIFYGIDYNVLNKEFNYDSTQDQVLYMRNNNPFDDVKYIFNEDVLFQYIPDMIIQSKKGYDDGLAYNFARYSNFGAQETIDFYCNEYGEWVSKGVVIPEIRYDDNVSVNVEINVGHIEELIRNHPDTEFIFFFPVRSILSFDRAISSMEDDFAIVRYTVNRLGQYDNAIIYLGLFNDEEAVMNLDNYCDWTHASYEINCKTAENLVPGSALLTSENVDMQLDALRQMIIAFEDKLNEEKSYDFLIDLY